VRWPSSGCRRRGWSSASSRRSGAPAARSVYEASEVCEPRLYVRLDLECDGEALTPFENMLAPVAWAPLLVDLPVVRPRTGLPQRLPAQAARV